MLISQLTELNTWNYLVSILVFVVKWNWWCLFSSQVVVFILVIVIMSVYLFVWCWLNGVFWHHTARIFFLFLLSLVHFCFDDFLTAIFMYADLFVRRNMRSISLFLFQFQFFGVELPPINTFSNYILILNNQNCGTVLFMNKFSVNSRKYLYAAYFRIFDFCLR